MADTYTTSLRLQQPTVGADSNTWGTILNTDWGLVDTAVAGITSISINGLTTYTLTAVNGATDQARSAVYVFTGTLTANCTVTLPAVTKIGWAVNNTTGGFSVILTTGSGGTATILPGGGWSFFECDGTDVAIPAQNLPSGNFNGSMSLSQMPLNQGTLTINYLLGSTSTTTQSVTDEFAFSVNLTSNMGSAGSVAAASNKVGIYTSVLAQSGSGNVWAINPVLGLASGACAIGGVQIAEFDMANNSGTDFGNSVETAGVGQPAAFGMQVTGVGSNACTAAIVILGSSTSKGGLWNAGIVFANNSTNRVSVLDENSPVYSYKITGAPTYGFDTSTAIISGAALRIGSQQIISSRNAAGTGDLILLETNGSDDSIYVGNSTSPYVRIPTSISQTGSLLGLLGATPVAVQNITGSKGGNVALANLITALAKFGLITDSTT
jgi:hypothetical protein